ncbi:centrosomal protein POC5-like [Styela clava]
MSSTSEDSGDLPRLPSETSRGSSVSSGLQEEYQELLKYAIVTPKWDPTFAQTEQPSVLPQLRLNEPDHRPLTTIDEYSAGSTSRTEEDSAVGSEEPETARKQMEPTWQMNNPEPRTPRPMPSPGRTPYRGPMLSPTASSGSERESIQRAPILSYLGQREGAEGGQDTHPQNGLDPDMARMSGQLDKWHEKLKTMVLAELSQVKIAMSESHRREIHRIKQEHQEEVDKLQNELAQLKELLHTYEVSVERKDQVISNLTRAVQTGHDRLEMARRMMQWKLRMIDERRQTFTTHLARKHRERALAMRAWQGWRSTIEAKWKERVEKACQKKAEEVCVQLTNDYEAKIASLNEALEDSRKEVARLHEERDRYEETMKKAFMRGVCALNLEAMSMFQGEENQTAPSEVQTLAAAVDALTCASECNRVTFAGQAAQKPDYLPPEPQPTRHVLEPSKATLNYSRPGMTSRPKSGGTGNKSGVVTGKYLSNPPIKTSGGKFPVNRSRTLSAKISATASAGKKCKQPHCQSEKFGPPPHGVLVERHHPNIQNYQTEQPLSHAVKYPYTPTRDIAPQQLPLPSEAFIKQKTPKTKN